MVFLLGISKKPLDKFEWLAFSFVFHGSFALHIFTLKLVKY